MIPDSAPLPHSPCPNAVACRGLLEAPPPIVVFHYYNIGTAFEVCGCPVPFQPLFRYGPPTPERSQTPTHSCLCTSPRDEYNISRSHTLGDQLSASPLSFHKWQHQLRSGASTMGREHLLSMQSIPRAHCTTSAPNPSLDQSNQTPRQNEYKRRDLLNNKVSYRSSLLATSTQACRCNYQLVPLKKKKPKYFPTACRNTFPQNYRISTTSCQISPK